MDITEISGENISIGKTSITVKREDGKIKGIVKGITIINKDLQPRTLFEVAGIFRKNGLNGMNFYNKAAFVDGEIVLLYNLWKDEIAERYYLNCPETSESEIQHYNEYKAAFETAKAHGLKVVYCRYEEKQ